MVGVKKVLTTVQVRRPDKQWFVSVHPDEKWRMEVAMIELKEENEHYVVAPALAPGLIGEAVPKILFTGMTRQGNIFLWPVKLPGPDGKHDDWNRSALQAASQAMKAWVRVVANKQVGGYELVQATANLPAPQWPDMDFAQVFKIAFKDRIITSLDHPVLRKLRGEV
jgi:hypothetical protein